MMTYVLNRRTVVNGLMTSAALIAAPLAYAQTEDSARKLIDAAVGDISKTINSGKSEGAMQKDFERIFKKYADVPTIARSALGPPARSASKTQLTAFNNAFTGYIARKYGSRFRDFIGAEIEVTGSRKVKSFQEVSATAKLKGKAPFAISFMVSDRSGSDKFFDLLIEGISLLKSERAEIGAMLDKRKGNVDALIADLKKAG